MADRLSERIDALEGEVVAFLRQVAANSAERRSNRLADLLCEARQKGARDVDRVLPFLRRNQLLAIDREARLSLTPKARQILGEVDQAGDGHDAAREALREALRRAFQNRNDSAAHIATAHRSQPDRAPLTGDDNSAANTSPKAASANSEQAREDSSARARNARDTETRRGESTAQARSQEQAPTRNAPSREATRYVRYDAIGEGPLCRVYRGRQSALGIDVAIKEPLPHAGHLALFSQEAILERLHERLTLQASLSHPCVVAVLDMDLRSARPGFVLEFCPGGNLRQKLSRRRGVGLDLEEALRVFAQIAHGLAFMHAHGVAHMNLKPENVLFDRFGNAKLTDPGPMRLTCLDGDRGPARLVIGTGGLDYLRPDNLREDESRAAPSLEQGFGADLYGAGVLLYEMLTGRLPGVRAPLPSELNKHVPVSLDTIFDRLTTGLEESRFKNTAALFLALGEAGDLPLRFDAAEVLTRTTATPPENAPGERSR